MSDDWLKDVHQLREESKRQAEAEQQKADSDNSKANQLLKQVQAHSLLRNLQKALLGGGGDLIPIKSGDNPLDPIKDAKYVQAISLAWQGPIHEPRKPNSDDSDDIQYILVGVTKQGQLHVNGKRVKPTEDTLKAALVEASKKPQIIKHQSGKEE